MGGVWLERIFSLVTETENCRGEREYGESTNEGGELLDFQEGEGGDLQHYRRPVCTFTFSLFPFLYYLCMSTLVLRQSLENHFLPYLIHSHFKSWCTVKSGFLEFSLLHAQS